MFDKYLTRNYHLFVIAKSFRSAITPLSVAFQMYLWISTKSCKKLSLRLTKKAARQTAKLIVSTHSISYFVLHSLIVCNQKSDIVSWSFERRYLILIVVTLISDWNNFCFKWLLFAFFIITFYFNFIYYFIIFCYYKINNNLYNLKTRYML